MPVSTEPLVTVLMPVYNGEQFLREAMESILNQTYQHLEFLIMNDGSTDNSVSVIETYKDPRIRLEHNPCNMGIAATLNRGIQLARGKYIVRMDCDDISFPERIEKQVAFMESHPEIGISATNMETSWSKFEDQSPCGPDEVRFRLLFYCCFGHPSVIMRKDVLDKQQLFYRSVAAEDYDLWVRASWVTSLYKTEETLVFHREHPRQLTRTQTGEIHDSADHVRLKQLAELGITPDQIRMNVHKLISRIIAGAPQRRRLLPEQNIADVVEWLNLLKESNKNTKAFEIERFDPYIDRLLDEMANLTRKMGQLKHLAESKQVYLFGCGRMGDSYLDFFRANSISPKGFIDNSSAKWGQLHQGIPVYSPNRLMEENEPYLVVITASYAEDIAKQLEAMSLERGRDFLEPIF